MSTDRRNFLRYLCAGAMGVAGRARSRAVAAPFQLAPPLRYPYLQNLVAKRVTVLWTTAESHFATVQYSVDRSSWATVEASIQEFPTAWTGLTYPFYQYQAELTDLNPGTDYSYRVILDNRNLTPLDDLHFRTPDSGPFRFLVFGDSGAGTPAEFSVAQRMALDSPVLVLHTGDLAYPNGRFLEFEQNYFPYYRDLMRLVPFFPCPGNHEYDTRDGVPYLAVHAVPTEGVPIKDRGRYYSFDWGNVHFISLDSNTPLAEAATGRGEMLDWLENDLQKTQQFWRIAYFHHPPYATGINQTDFHEGLVRDRIVPILERHDVQLVFNGHEHSYQRSKPLRRGVPVGPDKGTLYVTTGGGGANLYPTFEHSLTAVRWSTHNYVRTDVEGYRITVRAIRSDGVEIDKITLDRSPSRRRP
ncbi:MAG TPA: metallophosphoesterase [Acidobacteriota bacterium]|jgi:hypothetical protein|nr:metallophosphoesterase [Acidobacteriota bacterium]